MTATVTSAPPSVAVVEAGAEHHEMLADFYRAVWDPAAMASGVREAWDISAENPVTPGVPPPTFICVRDGQVIGYVTTIPLRLRVSGIQRVGHWVKGLMVRPQFRNGPVGMLVLREAVSRLGLAAALVVQPAPRRLFEALGFGDVGPLPNALRILQPERLLSALDPSDPPIGSHPALGSVLRLLRRKPFSALSAVAARTGTGAWLRVAGGGVRGPRAVRTARAAPPQDQLDRLWRRVIAGHPEWAGPSRDARTLRWRYAPDGPYLWVTTWTGTDLAGVAVLRAPRADGDPRLRGVRVATIADLLLPPGDRPVGLALLAGCEVLARDLGADALLCSATHRSVAPLLRRRAFAPLAGNVHFLIRDPDTPATARPALAAWWLTRGDSDADEVF